MRPRIIGLAGVAGSGKDTVAGYIEQHTPTAISLISFATPIKEFARKVFDWAPEVVYGPSELRNAIDPRGHDHEYIRACSLRLQTEQDTLFATIREAFPEMETYFMAMSLADWFQNLNWSALSARHVLQTLGTEWGRDKVHKDVWARIGVTRARTSYGVISVITDCRFDNEFRTVRSEPGAELWHIERPGAGLSGEAGMHASERDLHGLMLRELRTHWLHNSQTLERLEQLVEVALAQPLLHKVT